MGRKLVGGARRMVGRAVICVAGLVASGGLVHAQASDEVSVDDIQAVPFLDEQGRHVYAQFLKQDFPRAFVMTRSGFALAMAGGDDPLERALARCTALGKDCHTYAVDSHVIWVKPMDTPPATQFAPLANIKAIPKLSDEGRAAYAKFLSLPAPRAFALAQDGGWSWSSGGFDPLQRALEACTSRYKKCRLYAVDSDVTW